MEDPLLRHPISRRAFSAGLAVTLFLAACDGPGATIGAKVLPSAPPDPQFLKLSSALTGYDDLDPVIAARTSQAFHNLFPELAAQFERLTVLSAMHRDAENLLDAAKLDKCDEAALAIVAAWYTGTVGTGETAQAIAYADALMNRPVADGLFPPTYQTGGPAWWVAPPPSVDAPLPGRRSEKVEQRTTGKPN